ncbi:MAG: energy transducer TonB [Marinicellaceae bacterium]
MRYSASFFAAIAISLLLFLGMSHLITNTHHYSYVDFELAEFNMIEKIEETKKVIKPEKKMPEKKTVKQQPETPKLDILKTPKERPGLIPQGTNKNAKFNLPSVALPTMPANGPNGDVSKNGDAMCIVCIQPIYPHIASRLGTEGWVKVEFTVNKFGEVDDVKVIDSQPKRIFDQATIRSIYKSKFKPLVVDGKAMQQVATQVIQFKIEE